MASRLPLELWATVFLFLNKHPDWRICPQNEVNRVSAEYKELVKLQVVCRRFKAVIQAHHHLVPSLVLPERVTDNLLPSLLEWTQQRTASIKTFVAGRTTSQVDIALAGLGGQKAALEKAACLKCSTSTVHLLSRFSGLTHLVLAFSPPDLTCLEVLPALSCLELHGGRFFSDKLPPGLRRLFVYHTRCRLASATCCMAQLQQLKVSRSTLVLAPTGIAACMSLQCLHCLWSSILSDDADCNVLTGRGNMFHIPVTFSVLTCLTELVMRHNGEPAGPLELTNVYGLESLKCLELWSSTADVTIGNGLTSLRHLARLKLTVSHMLTATDDSDLRLRLDFNWAALDSLQHLSIQCDEFYCSHILDVLAIKGLQTVEITNTKPGDTSTSRSFALLVYDLAKSRPDVCVKLV